MRTPPEFEDRLPALIDAYPRLFKGSVRDPYSYLGPGWFSIVNQLCQVINASLSDAESDQFYVTQIKEKTGFLRFRFACSEAMRPQIRALVRATEDATMTICSDSGKSKEKPI
ncbi:hypothetical protein [Undibacterium danionis]|uniref:Uncharacterized protein n=1 Tax=Undibacterium danionis TaxID=1812100 RepID=A0ABV6IBN6_9BURK